MKKCSSGQQCVIDGRIHSQLSQHARGCKGCNAPPQAGLSCMLQLFMERGVQQDASTPFHCPGLSRKDFTYHRRGSEIGSPPCSFQRNRSFQRGIGETPRGEHEVC